MRGRLVSEGSLAGKEGLLMPSLCSEDRDGLSSCSSRMCRSMRLSRMEGRLPGLDAEKCESLLPGNSLE